MHGQVLKKIQTVLYNIYCSLATSQLFVLKKNTRIRQLDPWVFFDNVSILRRYSRKKYMQKKNVNFLKTWEKFKKIKGATQA